MSASFEQSDSETKQEINDIPSDLDEGYTHTSTDDTFAKASKKKYFSKSSRSQGKTTDGKTKLKSAAKQANQTTAITKSPLR